MILKVILSVFKSHRKVAMTDTKETTPEITRHKAGSLALAGVMGTVHQS